MTKSNGIRKTYTREQNLALADTIELMVDQGIPPTQICANLDINLNKLRKTMRIHGFKYSDESRSKLASEKHENPVSNEEIRKVTELVALGKTEKQIAVELNISKNRVYGIKQKLGLKLTKEQLSDIRTKIDKDLTEDISELRRRGYSIKEISKLKNYPEEKVIYIYCKNKIKITPDQRSEVLSYAKSPLSKQQREKIIELRNKFIPYNKIAEEVGAKSHTVKGFLLKRTEIRLPDENKIQNAYRGLIEKHPDHMATMRAEIQSPSMQELEVTDFVKSFGVELSPSENRFKIIPPYELDIYIPEKKLAIEYCGLYWHGQVAIENYHVNEKRRSLVDAHIRAKDKHYNKWYSCIESGIRLITLFSDEWVNRLDQTKGRIRSILDMDLIEVDADTCGIKSFDYDEVKEFLNENDIQGTVSAIYYNGLLFNGEIIGVATWSIYNSKMYLSRYCEKIGVKIPSGLNRLLNDFINNHPNVNKIYAYSDNRWENGCIYEDLGFNRVKEYEAGYSYYPQCTDGPREFSWNKSLAVRKFGKESENDTEWDIMKRNGYDRIWDCGGTKWELIISP